jgi:PTS system ascorbate-specific IIA component
MSVPVLLLTHAGLGAALLEAAKSVVGPLPIVARTVEFANGSDAEAYFRQAGRALVDLDRGDGVLVLTDVYGATPSNTAARLVSQGTRIRRVSGVNLSMVLRVCNYAEQTLDELAQTAASGARTGVVVDTL